MHIRAPPPAALLRYKQAYRDVGDDDNDSDSESDGDDDDVISCTVADDIIGFNNNRPFWGKCYQSRENTLGMYNDDSDDDDDVNDDWRVQIVDSYIHHVQEPFLSSSVEQTASLTASDESSGESFGDGGRHDTTATKKFHQPQQNIATDDPIADTMTRIMNAGMGISTSYESILPISTEKRQIREEAEVLNIPTPVITEQQKRNAIIAVITEQQKRKAINAVITGQQQHQQSNNNVRSSSGNGSSSSSSSSSSEPLKKRQRQGKLPIQQQREHEGEEKDQQQQQQQQRLPAASLTVHPDIEQTELALQQKEQNTSILLLQEQKKRKEGRDKLLQQLPAASLTVYPDIKQTELELQQKQQNKYKKKTPPLPKSRQDSMLFDDFKWNSWLIEATKFVETNKHGRIPTKYASNPGLGGWAKRQRYQFKVFKKQQDQNSTKDEVNKRGKLIKEIKCQMTPERYKALSDIGFCWDLQKGLWDSRYEELRKYSRENNGNACPNKYDAHELYKWMGTQRFQMTLFKRGKNTYLTPERVARLNEIGFLWENDNPNPDGGGLVGGIPIPGTINTMPENDSQGPYFI